MKKGILAVFCLLISAQLFAGYSGMPFEFLNAGLGARFGALGRAGTAMANDAAGMYFNPALLDNAVENRAMVTAETLLGGAHYETLAYVNPLGKTGAFGINFGIVNYGEYENVNEDGLILGKDSMSDMFLSMGYGRNLFAGIKGGLAIKAVIRSMGNKSYTGFNADIGLTKNISGFDIGLSCVNVLPLSVKYSVSEEKFVTGIRAGLGYTYADWALRVMADVEKKFVNSDPSVSAGAEISPLDGLYLRAGIAEAIEKNALTAGFGYASSGFAIDYALEYSEGMMHSITLSYGFNGYVSAVTAEPAVFSPLGGNKKTYLRITSRQKYDPFKWKLVLKNSKGEFMKVWEGPGAPDESYVWDGIADDGMPCAEGEYTAVLTVTDENDSVSVSDACRIKISNTGDSTMPMGIE